jgi:hypothetical protein
MSLDDDLNDFECVKRVAKSASNIKMGMNQLLDYCEQKRSDPIWATIRSLDFEGEIPKLRTWLENVLSSESPSKEIIAFWFGLFNPILDDGKPSCGLYVSGSTQFDPDDETGDWAAWEDDSYLPVKRYANSKILHEIYRYVSENDNVSDFAEYILALGYSCLAVKDICHPINPKLLLGDRERRDIAVGFDSGDFIILEDIEG